MSTDILLAAIIGLLVPIVVIAVFGYEAFPQAGGTWSRMRMRLRHSRRPAPTAQHEASARGPAVGGQPRDRKRANGSEAWARVTAPAQRARRSAFLEGDDLARVRRWLGRDPNTFEHLLFAGIFALRGPGPEQPTEMQWPTVEPTTLGPESPGQQGIRCPQCAVSEWRGATVCQGCGRVLTPAQRAPAGDDRPPGERETPRGAPRSVRRR